MGEPKGDPTDQAETVIERLEAEYPDSTISLRFSNRLELLIAVILSAQCTDARVNAETEELFDTYRSAEAYANASQEELASALDSINFYNSKAGYIREACAIIVEEHDGAVPDTMTDLTDLPGVGRKTANVVLQHGHDVVEGIVVDTHVQRLSRRLGLAEAEQPEKIEAALMEIVPAGHWVQFTHLLIDHGRAVCTARTPDCDACVLADVCPSERGDSSVDLASGEPW